MWAALKKSKWTICYAVFTVWLAIRTVDSYDLSNWWAGFVFLFILLTLVRFLRDRFLAEYLAAKFEKHARALAEAMRKAAAK